MKFSQAPRSRGQEGDIIRIRQRVQGTIFPIALILTACAQASPTPPPESVPSSNLGTDETLIAEIDLEAIVFETFTVSPNGRRVAYSAQYSDGQRVFLDNVSEGPYEKLQESAPIFSRDGEQLAYVADVAGERYVVVNGRRLGPYQDIGVPVFSPQDGTLAFKVRLGPWQAIVRGEETLRNYDQVDNPHFAANGRLAYSARDGDEWFAVIDGVEGPRFEDVYFTTRPFSADGLRVAYLGVRAEDWYVVLDGEEFGPYASVAEGSLAFSSDGSHVAYLAQVGEWWRVIVDGVAGRLFDSAGAPAFSADGDHWMHPAAWGGNAYLVLDGSLLGPYRAVAPGVTFGPQGGRYAYFAQVGDSWFAFADGERGPGFTTVAPLSLTFSPDGESFAYAALRGEEWVVVAQGRELGPYEAVVDGSFAFSPDGNRLAFVIQSGESYQVVLEGELGTPYTTILAGHMVFSQDGSQLAYAASRGESRFVVLDGEEGPGFEALILGTVGTIMFDGPDGIHYLGVRGSEIYLVEVGKAG